MLSEQTDRSANEYPGILRKIAKKTSFHGLFWLLEPGEVLICRYYCYNTNAYTNVPVLSQETFSAWQQAEEAGTHRFEEAYGQLYSVKHHA